MFVYLHRMELTDADKLAIRIMKNKSNEYIAKFLNVEVRVIEKFRFNERFNL